MLVYGVDFTSAPAKRKPITCARCQLEADVLVLEGLETFTSFTEFKGFLDRPGPWLVGIDAPFGQPRRLIKALSLPLSWSAYVRHFAALGKEGFSALLRDYKARQAKGDKEHKRRVDALARAVSPMKLYRVPVGKMFFELAPRLEQTELNLPLLRPTQDKRTVLEAYPALVARHLIGAVSYKSDTLKNQTREQQVARMTIVSCLNEVEFKKAYDLTLSLTNVQKKALAADPKADTLDALLCAVQAAWAARQDNYGIPDGVDGLEGWIADPLLT